MSRWVLVADNSHARLLSYQSHRLEQFYAIDHPEGRLANRDINSDGPGRNSRNSGHACASGYQPLHDAKEQITDQFVKKLCNRLSKERHRKAFDELYVCAPPAMLGRLRAKMPDQLRQCVSKEVAKDLVNADNRQVLRNLR